MQYIQLGARLEAFVPNYQQYISVKSLATLTALAFTTLGGAFLAYRNPRQWIMTTLSVCLADFYLLPRVLRHGNAQMIKGAILLHLTAMGSLVLGGIVPLVATLAKAIGVYAKAYNFSNALFCSFLLTGLIGYGAPLALKNLQNVYEMLAKGENWRQMFEKVRLHFNQQPEVGLGFLQCNLWESLLLHGALLAPTYLRECYQKLEKSFSADVKNILLISSDRGDIHKCQEYVEELEHYALIQEFNNLGVNDDAIRRLMDMLRAQNQQDDDELEEMEEALRNLMRNQDLDDIAVGHLKDRTYQSLKLAIETCQEGDLPQVINLILTHITKLTPRAVSYRSYAELFQEEALEVADSKIQQFIDILEEWPDIEKQELDLYLEAKAFHDELKKLTPQELSDIKEGKKGEYLQLKQQNFQDLNQRFLQLRTRVEAVYQQKRIWQDFERLIDEDIWPAFDQQEALQDILKDQALLRKIDFTYQSLMGKGLGVGNHQNLADTLQIISNKLSQLESQKDDDEQSLILFLALEYAFIQKDYHDLQKWLQVDSPHQVEDKLKEIGLVTQEDIENKVIGALQNEENKAVEGELEDDIVEKENDVDVPKIKLTKAQLRENLKHFIEDALSVNDEVLVDIKAVQEPFMHRLAKKVTHVIYRLIVAGSILTPVLIFPKQALIGFGVGAVFFVLQYFGCPGTQDIADMAEALIVNLPFGNYLHRLLNRRIIHLNRQQIGEREDFIRADFFERMRIINWHLVCAFYVTVANLHSVEEGHGGFIQGIALAHEVAQIVLP